MRKIPVSFEYEGKKLHGHLHAVLGSGDARVWHLMINGYYWGRLRYTSKWVYDSDTLSGLAELFGAHVTAAEGKQP